MVEYVYPGGVRLLSQCRQMPGCWSGNGEYVHGTEGICDLVAGTIVDQHERVSWQSDYTEAEGHGLQQEQTDLIHSLRSGVLVNETREAAYSTMTAIMGRMATIAVDASPADAMNHDQSLATIDHCARSAIWLQYSPMLKAAIRWRSRVRPKVRITILVFIPA